MDSDFSDDPVSRKSTTGSAAQIGNHTVKSGSTLLSITALCVGEAEIYAVVKKCQVGLSLNFMYHDLGIPMKIERTKRQLDGEFIDHPRRRLQCQEGAHSEELRRNQSLLD